MTALPEPQFIDRDPAVITTDLIAAFEAETGRVLQPAQVERLIIDMIAYRETLTRIAAQEVGKLNLLRFSRYPMLDHLGELVGVARLPAQTARTTLRFTLTGPLAFDVDVPQGTRARTRDGSVTFATEAPLTLAAGTTGGTVAASAIASGTAANGHAPGAVAVLIDPIAYVAAVTNDTPTSGGADTEDDDRLRERIRLAPHVFSVAGPEKAYAGRVKDVHQNILDVAVLSPAPGEIEIRPLMRDGLPSAAMLLRIAEHVTGEKVRPLGDAVTVLPPEEVPYTLVLSVTRYTGSDAAAVQAAVVAALETECARLRQRLGLDIVPKRFEAVAMGVSGVYDVAMVAPAATIVLHPHQVARCDGLTVAVTGAADG